MIVGNGQAAFDDSQVTLDIVSNAGDILVLNTIFILERRVRFPQCLCGDLQLLVEEVFLDIIYLPRNRFNEIKHRIG